jgi:DNA-binding XRE family transcriptional regulator
MDNDQFKPIVFDPKAYASQRSLSDSVFKQTYDALENEFAALESLLQARKEAGLTQADVAAKMGISPSMLARIESSLGNRKNSPSLATLRRYASVCGKKLIIQMVD